MNENLTGIVEKYFADEPYRTVLDNGLTVIAKEDNSADVVSVQVWVKTGSIHEDPLLGSGISHYVEHMLFKGTEKRPCEKIAQDVYDAGASVNAYTTFDRTVYYIDGQASAAETAFEVLSDIVFNSTFNPEETKKEQSVILREIDMGLDDPDQQLMQSLFKTVYQRHPYRHPVIGERSLFEQITRDQLYEYYKGRYVPNNMTLVVTGARPIADLLKMAEDYFGKQPQAFLSMPILAEEPMQLSKRTFYKQGDYNIVRGMFAFQVPGLRHEDTPGLGMLANVLGQGQSSHLWQELREKQKLVHSIASGMWNPGTRGLFTISYTCDVGTREKVEEAILTELDNFHTKGISEEKLKMAVTQAMVGEVNQRKTMSGQASRLGLSEVVVGDLHYAQTYLKKLEALTEQTLLDSHKEYLNENQLSTLAFEPESDSGIELPSSGADFELKDFEKVTFDNGARVLIQEHSHIPKIHIKAVMHGGALFETPHLHGATGILATLLTKDTEKRKALEVAQTIENIGGGFSEYVGNNSFGFGIEVMSQDLAIASDILEQALTKPMLTEKQFLKEQDAQIAAIKEELDDINDQAMRRLRQKFFGDFPYSHDCLGTLKTVGALTLDDIKKLKNQLIHPENLIISVSGDVDREELLKSLEWVKKLKGDGAFKNPEPEFTPGEESYVEHPMDKEQVVVFEAYPGITVADERLDASDILEDMLSSMSSKLFANVREKKGMAYYVGSSRMIGTTAGMIYFYAGTNQENYKNVFEEFSKEIERIQTEEIDDDEFNRSKTRLKAGQKLGFQAPASRAMNVALNELFGLPLNHWRTHDTRIDSVTKKQVQQFAKDQFKKENRVRLAIGNVK